MAEHVPFKPKKLSTLSLEAPMQRRWDVMGADEAKRLHTRALDTALRFSWTGPRSKQRMMRYLVMTPIGFGCLGFFFVGSDLRTVAIFLLVGLPLGGLRMMFRTGDFLSGLLYALCGAAAIVGSGHTGFLPIVFGVFLLGTIGMLVGRGDEVRRFDMED